MILLLNIAIVGVHSIFKGYVFWKNMWRHQLIIDWFFVIIR